MLKAVDYVYEVGLMFWKTMNLQLKKGSIFLLHGDSAPIFRKICVGNGRLMLVH